MCREDIYLCTSSVTLPRVSDRTRLIRLLTSLIICTGAFLLVVVVVVWVAAALF